MLTDLIKNEILHHATHLNLSGLKSLIEKNPDDIKKIHELIGSMETLNAVRRDYQSGFLSLLIELQIPADPRWRLNCAISERNIDEIKSLLNSKTVIIEPDFMFEGEPILFYIMDSFADTNEELYEIIRAFISNGIDPNIRHPETNSLPLEIALNTSVEIFSYLLERTKNINEKSLYISGNNIIFQSLMADDITFLKAAVELGCDIHSSDAKNYSLMTRACTLNDEEPKDLIEKLVFLNTCGLSYHERDKGNRLPIEAAIEANQVNATIFLMQNEVDIQALSKENIQALIGHMINQGEVVLLKKILQTVPKENRISHSSELAFVTCCQNGVSHLDALSTQELIMRQYQLAEVLYNDEVNLSYENELLLTNAIQHACTGVIIFLMEKNISINQLDQVYLSRLMIFVIAFGSTDMLKRILNSVGQLTEFINQSTYVSGNFWTPLTWAISSKADISMIETLLIEGANPNQIVSSTTPLLMAIKCMREDVAILLTRYQGHMSVATPTEHPLFYAVTAGFIALLKIAFEQQECNPNAVFNGIPLIVYSAICDSLKNKTFKNINTFITEIKGMPENSVPHLPDFFDNSTDVTAFLLVHGADITATLDGHITALHIAVISDNTQLLLLLIKNLLRHQEAKRDDGNTLSKTNLLHYVKTEGMLNTLMKVHPEYTKNNFNTSDQNGKVPFNYAPHVVQYALIKLGAAIKPESLFPYLIDEGNFSDPGVFGLLNFFKDAVQANKPLKFALACISKFYHQIATVLTASTPLSTDLVQLITEYDDPFVRYSELKVSREPKDLIACPNGLLKLHSLFSYMEVNIDKPESKYRKLESLTM